MDLEKYRPVIKLVLARHAGETPEQISDKLIESLEIAAALSGEIAPPQAPETRIQKVSIETSPQSQPKPQPAQKGAVILSVAPPVAGTGESGEDAPDADVDYWESRPGKGDGCTRLEQKLKSILPVSITLKVPGVDKPIELVRGIGSPGLRFVHVSYTIAGDTLGPRYTVMTSQKDIDAQAILDDIASQAAVSYSAEKRTIEARPGPPVQPPSGREMQEALERDMRSRDPRDRSDGLSGDEARLAAEDAKHWGGQRGVRWQ